MEAPIGISTSRSGFHRELERLQDEVLVLGSMVEKAITRSVDALKARNTIAARAKRSLKEPRMGGAPTKTTPQRGSAEVGS